MLAPLALGGLLSPIVFCLVALTFLDLELGRLAKTDFRFFSLSISLILLPRFCNKTAVLGVAVTAVFLDPPLPLLYYEFILYFLFPNNGLVLIEGCSTSVLAFTLLKKSKDS